MFSNDRMQLRRFFIDTWSKQKNEAQLDPMEKIVANIIQQHPEYHSMLEQQDLALDKDFLPEAGETNPFLHISMHISLQEQISTDRPPGITAAYRKLLLAVGDSHAVDHKIMECLGRMLWQAQINNTIPDEMAYMECVNQLVVK